MTKSQSEPDRFQRALNQWGRRELKARGYTDVSSVGDITIDSDHIKGYGGCSTCDYGGECELSIDVTYPTTKRGRKSVTFDFYDFGRIVRELVNEEV